MNPWKASLGFFSIACLRAQRTVVRRPRAVFLGLVLSTALACIGLPKLAFVFSAQDMVGEGIPSADELDSLKERFAEGTTSALLLAPPEGRELTTEELCAVRRWYSLARASDGEIKNAISTFDLKLPVADDTRRMRYQNVLQLDCEGMRQPRRAEEIVRVLNSSPWPALHDRTGRLGLFLTFQFRDSESEKFGSFDPRVLATLRESAIRELPKLVPGLRMDWVGLADYQWYVREGFRFSLVVNSGMVLGLLLLLRALHGTWRSGVIFCGTLILTGLWLYGLKGLLGSPYDVLASGIFLILGVASIEDFTFLSSELGRGRRLAAAARELLVPSFFTSLTTILGFASLAISDLEIIRRFGLWCALGALIEWVMVFFVLPAVLRGFGPRFTWVEPGRGLGSRVDSWATFRPPRWLVRLSLLAFPLAVLAFPGLSSNDHPARIFPAGHPYREGLDRLAEAKGFQGTASLVWDEADPSMPRDLAGRLRALEGAGEGLERDGSIEALETVDRSVRWLADQGPIPETFAREDFKPSLLHRQLVDPDERPRAIAYLRDISAEAILALAAKAQEACGGACHLAGDLVAYADFSTRVPDTLVESMALSLGLVAAVIIYLGVALGQVSRLPALIGSSLWGPCVLVIALSGMGIPIDFLKCIILSIAVGLTGDNAIQYLFASRRGGLASGVERRGGPSILTNCLMAATALFYLASYFDPPKQFGLILASCLLLSLVGDLWILNGYLDGRAEMDEPSNSTPG